jgi:hypothetical protein
MQTLALLGETEAALQEIRGYGLDPAASFPAGEKTE